MKKQIIRLIILFILLVSVAAAQTQPQKPTTLVKTRDQAVKNHPNVVESGNVPGWNLQLHLLSTNRTHWLAKSDNVSSNIISVHDPEWIVSSDNGKTWTRDVEWITIIDDRGGLWQSKIHAEIANKKFLVHLENKHNGASNGKNGPIDILDWHGKKWQIASVGASDDAVVKFNLVAK